MGELRTLEDKPSGKCECCRVRDATERWIGEASTMEVAHGSPIAFWCEPCCVSAQIIHCERVIDRMTDELPELRAKRDKLRSEGNDPSR
jgi:hypothetical protein